MESVPNARLSNQGRDVDCSPVLMLGWTSIVDEMWRYVVEGGRESSCGIRDSAFSARAGFCLHPTNFRDHAKFSQLQEGALRTVFYFYSCCTASGSPDGAVSSKARS